MFLLFDVLVFLFAFHDCDDDYLYLFLLLAFLKLTGWELPPSQSSLHLLTSAVIDGWRCLPLVFFTVSPTLPLSDQLTVCLDLPLCEFQDGTRQQRPHQHSNRGAWNLRSR
jgi:hypothetical protein